MQNKKQETQKSQEQKDSDFIQHLKKSAQRVKEWPAWKQRSAL